ncbi:MAG: hypothetical protein ABII96_10605 [Candidatus Zixiibacteriota bacterium]
MLQPIMFTLRASVVPFQLLRPLPTIFASVGGVTGEGCSREMPASVRKEFDSHLDCLADMVNVLAEMKALTPADRDKLSRMLVEVKEAEPADLCEKTSLFNRRLEEICENQKTAVREECRAHPFVFRDLYRSSVRVKKLCLIYQDETNERIGSLKDLLCDRCYYDVETRSEESIRSQPVHSDFVIYAPTQHAGDVYFDGMPKAGLPLLLMIDLGKSIEDCSIADLRRVFRHQQNHIDVLYSPFPPIHLFQKIDITYIPNLYKMSGR